LIHYFVRASHSYTYNALAAFRTPAAKLFRCVHYEALRPDFEFAPGVYVFSDLERLPHRHCQQLAEWLRAVKLSPRPRILNHPTRSLRRYELLRTLYEAGKNPFNAYRVTERRMPARYPVFLREEREHSGPTSALLCSEVELRRDIENLDRDELSREERLIVEFADTAGADGLYRKYSAYRIGDAYLPKHVLFSRHWMQKHGDLVEDALIDEEEAFLRDFPHREQVKETFETARIDYGRVDYGVKDGKIVVWEINTNPFAQAVPEQHPARRHDFALEFERLAGAAFEALLSRASG
jgi:hypothetical protein